MSIIGALLSDIYILLPSPFALYNFFVYGKNIYTYIELPKYLKMSMPVDNGNKIPLINYQDKISEEGGSKELVSVKTKQKIIDSIFVQEIKKEFETFTLGMNKLIDSLKNRNDLLDKGKLTLNDIDAPKILSMMLQDQCSFLNRSILCRIEIIKVTLPNLLPEIKTELSVIEQYIKKLHKDLLDKIDKIRKMNDEKQQIKIFFDDLNAYRNKVRKEIIKYETMSHNGFKKNLPDLYKLKEFKQLVNVEVPKSVKQVVDQDGY